MIKDTLVAQSNNSGGQYEIWRCFGCPSLTVRNSIMYLWQDNTLNNEANALMAFRDSSDDVHFLADTLFIDSHNGSPQEIKLGHGGGDNWPVHRLIWDSTYVSATNTTGGGLFGINNFWPPYVKFRYNTIFTPNDPIWQNANSNAGPDTCACDFSHNTFIANLSPTDNMLNFSTGHFNANNESIIGDTLGLYSNIFVNINPGGTSSNNAGDFFVSKNKTGGDRADRLHAGFNIHYNRWSSNLIWADHSIASIDSNGSATYSASGSDTTSNNGSKNKFAMEYQKQNRLFGDFWSINGNPHLAGVDSILKGQRSASASYFLDVTPLPGSLAYGHGAPGANGVPTTVGAVGPKFAAQKINVVTPLDQGVPGDQDFVIWLPEGSFSGYVDSLVISAPDSVVCPAGGCRLPSDSLFTGFRTPLHCSYVIHGTYASNLTWSGTFLGGGASTFAMNPGDVMHTTINWVQPGGGVHSTDLYIEIDSDDPNRPITRIMFDFGFGHVHF